MSERRSPSLITKMQRAYFACFGASSTQLKAGICHEDGIIEATMRSEWLEAEEVIVWALPTFAHRSSIDGQYFEAVVSAINDCSGYVEPRIEIVHGGCTRNERT
jgi:hypothetical protein